MRTVKEEIKFLKLLEKLSFDQAELDVGESLTKLFLGQAAKLRSKINELEDQMPPKKKARKKR